MCIVGDAAEQAQCHSSVGDLDLELLALQQDRCMHSSCTHGSEIGPGPSLSDSCSSQSYIQKETCF